MNQETAYYNLRHQRITPQAAQTILDTPGMRTIKHTHLTTGTVHTTFLVTDNHGYHKNQPVLYETTITLTNGLAARPGHHTTPDQALRYHEEATEWVRRTPTLTGTPA